jgi:hypothetical protein
VGAAATVTEEEAAEVARAADVEAVKGEAEEARGLKVEAKAREDLVDSAEQSGILPRIATRLKNFKSSLNPKSKKLKKKLKMMIGAG